MATNPDLDALVFRASHDLKTPVVAISGLAQVLRRQLDRKLDPAQRALFSRIDANVELLSARLDDLVAVARAAAVAADPSEAC